MNRLNTSLLSIFLILYSISFSQTFSIKNESLTKFNNIGVIADNNKINGYFIFYPLKTKKIYFRSKRSYVLHILDRDLNKINSDTLIGSYNLNLLEGTSNGKNLMFKLYDPELYKVTYLNYDRKGKLIAKDLVEILGGLYINGQPFINEDFQSNASLFPIKNKGFASYNEVHFRRRAYTINFVPNNKETGQYWEFKSNKKLKRLLKANFLHSSENILFSLVTDSKNSKGIELKYYIQCLDLNTGKEIVKIDLSKHRNKISITSAFYDEINKHITVFGEYYTMSKRTLKTPSSGLITLTFDLKGNEINQKKTTWSNDVNKFIDVTAEGKGIGKTKDRNFTYFHKFFEIGDGNIYAIGEEFRKNTFVAGEIASVVFLGLLGAVWAGDNTEFIIDDLVIYKFNSEFELLDVKTIEKEQNVVAVNGRYITPHQWARIIKAYGGFDYAYTTINEIDSSFVINYIDHPKSKNWYSTSFKSCLVKNEDMEFNEVLLSPKKSKVNYRILPAKDGYFLFSEYFKKEDKLELKLRKFDFNENETKKSSSN